MGRLAIASLVAGLAGCPAPYAETTTLSQLDGDAMVLEGSADEAQGWGAEVVIEDAPPGEYFLFASSERPTSTGELAAFEPADCASTSKVNCSVSGLGDYAGLSKLDAAGRLTIRSAGGGSPTPTKERFFTLVWRAKTPQQQPPQGVAVRSVLSIFGGDGGGCAGNPDSPAVHASAL